MHIAFHLPVASINAKSLPQAYNIGVEERQPVHAGRHEVPWHDCHLGSATLSKSARDVVVLDLRTRRALLSNTPSMEPKVNLRR